MTSTDTVHAVPRRLALAIVGVLGLVMTVIGLLASAGPAAAAKPCGRELVDDWYNGRIDGAYPVRCYREALAGLPEDLAAYSSAREDIQRALLLATRRNDGNPPGPNAVIPPQPQPPSQKPGGRAPSPEPGGPVNQVLDKIGPKDATSVPVPLIVLAAIALLLLAAAGASLVTRRLQERRVPVSQTRGQQP